MSGFIQFGSGATPQARNPQRVYEALSFTSDGLQLTNSNGSNAVGSYSAFFTPSNNLSELILYLTSPSSTGTRYQITIRRNSDSVVIVPDYHVQLPTGGLIAVRIPINFSSGVQYDIAIRTSANGATIRVAAEGVIANSLDSAGFTTMTAINVNTAATRAGTQTVGNGGTWVELKDVTAAEYGGLMAVVCDNNGAPAAGQRWRLDLSTGTADNEDASIFWSGLINFNTVGPYLFGANMPVIQNLIASGSRLSVKGTAPTSNSDLVRVGLWGLS